MTTREFDITWLEEQLVLEHQGDESSIVDYGDLGSPTMSIPDRNLHVECFMIFEAEDGTRWRTIYHRMCDYYVDRVGEDCSPFEYTGGDFIKCESVEKPKDNTRAIEALKKAWEWYGDRLDEYGSELNDEVYAYLKELS